MARKTNKTNHVLGLLAGKGEEVSTAEDKRQAAVNEAKSDTAAGSNVQVVAKQEEDEAIADTVKHLLEEELEAEDTDTVRTPEIIFDEDEEEALKAAEEKEKQVEKEYVFLNVMETLVRERVDTYMNQFATCQCSRCKADIIALALTSLPSKYVVVSRNAATPLMNFYSQRYAGVITVEITKACTKVKEHPHHGRD